jgi:divalent metal cation (Fe/Co/Zn/Cd) transporter
MKYAEACLLAGTWLLVSGQPYGWAFVTLSLILAFARFSIEVSEKKQAQEKMSDGAKALVDVITGVVAAAGVGNDKSGKTILH